MANELGELKYVIEANTKQLDEAVKSINTIVASLDSFTKKLNQVLGSVTKTQKETKASTEKTSEAIKRSSQKASRNLSSQRQRVQELKLEYDFLRKKVLEVNAPIEILGRSARSLKSLKNIMKDNKKSVAEVNAALRRTQGVFRRAERDLAEFASQQKRVEQQTRATESAISKQETALSRAKLRVRGVVDELRRLGAGKQEFKKIGKEFAEFQKTMRSGQLSTLEFAKAQNRFNERIDILKRKAADAANRTSTFERRMQELTKTVQIALGPLSGVAARLTAFTSLATASNIGIALLLSSFVAFGVSLIKVANVGRVAQEQFFNLKSLLAATGKEALLTLNQIDKVTREQAKLTLSSTQVNRSLAGIFLASNLPASRKELEEFLQLAQGIVDLSGGTVGPQSAANKLVRLFEDPANSIETLAEIGIRFSKVQQQIIKNFIEMGNKGAAIEIIRDRLSAALKASEDRAKGLSGAIDTFGETVTEVYEKIALETGVLKPFTDAVNFVTGILDSFKESEIAIRILNTFVRLLVRILSLLVALVGTLLTVGAALSPFFALIASFKTATFTVTLLNKTFLGMKKVIIDVISIIPALITRLKIFSIAAIDAAKKAITATVAAFSSMRKAIAAASVALFGFVKRSFAAMTAAMATAFPKIVAVSRAMGVLLAGSIVKVAKALRTLFVTNPIVRVVGIILLAVGAITALILTVSQGKEALKDFSSSFVKNFKKIKDTVVEGIDTGLEFLFPSISGDFLIDTESEKRFIERINNAKKSLSGLRNEVEKTRLSVLQLVPNTPESKLLPIFRLGFNVEDTNNQLDSVIKRYDKVRTTLNDLVNQGVGITDILSKEEAEQLNNALREVDKALKNITDNPPKSQDEIRSAFEKIKNALQNFGNAIDVTEKKLEDFGKKKALNALKQEARNVGDALVELINSSAKPFLEIVSGQNAQRKLESIKKRYSDITKQVKELSKAFPEAKDGVKNLQTLLSQLGIKTKDQLDLLFEIIGRNGSVVAKQISQIKFQNQLLDLQNQKIGASAEKVREIDEQIAKLNFLRNIGIPVETIDDLDKFKGILSGIKEELQNIINKTNELNRQKFFKDTLKDLIQQQEELSIKFQFLGREQTLEAIKALSNFKLRIRAQEIGLSDEDLNKLIAFNEKLQELQFNYNRIQDIANAVKEAFSSSLDSFIQALIDGENELKAFKNIFISVIDAIIKKLVQLFIIDKIVNGISGIINKFVPGSGGSGSDLGITSGLNFKVNVPSGLNLSNPAGAGVPKFASGGIISSPVKLVAGNKRGLAGESGPEAILPLTKVGGKLGVAAVGGGSNVVVNVIDQRSSPNSQPVEIEQRRGPDGLTELRILIRDQIRGMLDSGEFDKNLGMNFGIRRRGIR